MTGGRGIGLNLEVEACVEVAPELAGTAGDDVVAAGAVVVIVQVWVIMTYSSVICSAAISCIRSITPPLVVLVMLGVKSFAKVYLEGVSICCRVCPKVSCCSTSFIVSSQAECSA